MIGQIFSLGAVITLTNQLSPVAERIGKDLDQLRDRIQNIDRLTQRFQGFQRLARAGQTLSLVALPLSGTVGLAISSAIDFERAFAGVRRTVEGTPQQLAAVAQEFRALSTEIPISATELARVGQVAGQLGVPIRNITEFTSVAAKMGATTDLSAEQASFAMARLSEIMQEPLENVDRLGATIVDLGNNFATTEPEITEMALRIAGAGQVVGLTTPEVLGFAAALSAVGINAEAGGSSISRTMIEIANSVASADERLTLFAAVAGMTAEEFARSFREDPTAALSAFAEGLSIVEDEGINVFEVLDQLGLADIRVRDALLRLAGAQGLIAEATGRASRAFEESTALETEFSRIVETTWGQLQILWNTFMELARTIGDSVLPVINAVIPRAKAFLEFLIDLPRPVHFAIAAVLGLVALAGPLLFFIGVAGQLAVGVQVFVALARSVKWTSVALRGLRAPIGWSVAGLRRLWTTVAGTGRAVRGLIPALRALPALIASTGRAAIGGLIPALRALPALLVSTSRAIVRGLVPTLQTLSTLVAGTGRTVRGLIPTLRALPALLRAVGMGWRAALGPIGLVAGAASLLYAAWRTNFLGFRDFVGSAVEWIRDKLNGLWEFIRWLVEQAGRVLFAPFRLLGRVASAVGDWLVPDEARPSQPPVTPGAAAPPIMPTLQPAAAGAGPAPVGMVPQAAVTRIFQIQSLNFNFEKAVTDFDEEDARRIYRLLQRVAEEEEARVR